MARHALKFGRDETHADLPDAATMLAARSDHAEPKNAEAIARALEEQGAIEALTRSPRIALVVNDQTRKGGMRVTLDAIAKLLDRAQVDRSRVDLVVAYGLHARQTDEASRAAYGESILSRARLVHHDGRDPHRLTEVGSLPDGARLSLATEVARAELRLLVGAISFHYYAGFSGGRKAILPGVADEASIVRNHLRVLDPSGPGGRAAGCRPAGLDGNPVSEEMFAAVRVLDRLGGQTFLANAIVDPSGNVADFACGADHERAFREGCARLLRRNSVALDPFAPLEAVVASAGGWPYDATLYQAHKAYDNAFRALAPGIAAGARPTLVFVARCLEGLGHPRFSAWLEHETRETHYLALRAGYEIVGQTSLAVRDKAALTRTIAVTELDEATCARLGWERAHTVEEALRMAGTVTRWGVMPYAAQVLPLLHVHGAERETTPGVGT